MDLEQIIFNIISHAGNARSNCFEALKYAKEGDFDKSYDYLNQAKEELIETHQIQTEILQKEASGSKQEITLLLMHAEDHLMNAILAKELITELIEVYKELNKYSTSLDS